MKCIEALMAHDSYDLTRAPMTLGVEIEGYVRGGNFGKKGVAETLRQELQSLYSDAQVTVLNELHSRGGKIKIIIARPGKPDRIWSVQEDTSLYVEGTQEYPRFHEGAEVVSPVISERSHALEVWHVTRALERVGMKADPSVAGFHLHVGMPDPTAPEVAVIIQAVGRVQESLIRFLGVSQNRAVAGHTKKIRPATVRSVESGLEGGESIEQVLATGMVNDRGGTPVPDYTPDRGFILNFWPMVPLKNELIEVKNAHTGEPEIVRMITDGSHPLSSKPAYYETLEGRLFNSTLEWDQIKVQSEFMVRLVHAVRSQKPELMKFLQRPLTEPTALQEFFDAIGYRVSHRLEVFASIHEHSLKSLSRSGREVVPQGFDRAQVIEELKEVLQTPHAGSAP